MNYSFSQDVLQKMRMQQKNSQIIQNTQKYLSSTFASKTQYINVSQSPKQITYNQIIHDGQTKMGSRYKLRNCKQPNLKIIERQSLPRQKAHSLLGLKELMKQQIYQHALQKYADHQIAENLKLDLLFLPNPVKIAHRNRYRPNRQVPHSTNIISISGNRIKQLKPHAIETNRELQQLEYPQISKKTAGFQLKYRKHYLRKKSQNSGFKQRQKTKYNQDQLSPLTGWF